MKFSKVLSFLTLSAFEDILVIEQLFSQTHDRYKTKFLHWSINSTRQKLKTDFWYHVILKHFGIVCFLSLILLTAFSPGFWDRPKILLAIPVSLGISFFPIILLIYFSTFYAVYLPLVDTCIEGYNGTLLQGIQKCKKEQYSVKALVLIQQVFHRLSGLDDYQTTSEQTFRLVKQYGISKQMIESSYKEVFLQSREKLTGRKYTEMEQSFEEAENYFEGLNSIKALTLLQELKAKVLARANKL